LPPRAQEQLKIALSKNAGRVIDLFREWDADGDGQVSKKEFRKAMPLLGFDASKEVIDTLFDEYDDDGAGSIGYKELRKMLAPSAAPSAAPAASAKAKAGKAAEAPKKPAKRK